jgi:hypothetical protein
VDRGNNRFLAGDGVDFLAFFPGKGGGNLAHAADVSAKPEAGKPEVSGEGFPASELGCRSEKSD